LEVENPLSSLMVAKDFRAGVAYGASSARRPPKSTMR
jgi:hypothetical protein